MLMPELRQSFPAGAASLRLGPVEFLSLSEAGAIEFFRSAVLAENRTEVAICNAHTFMIALDRPSYAATLEQMTVLNDGVGIDFASRFLNGAPFPANLNGTDLIPAVLGQIGLPLRIYLLGAKAEQVSGAARHIAETYPGHQVVGYRDGYFSDDDVPAIRDAINASRADLLLVAMGNPRQEDFIIRNREHLNPTICVGVGALFDFMSGAVVRAPEPIRKVGMEWLFRLLQEPGRLSGRYLVGIPRFFTAIARMRWGQAVRNV